MTAAIVLIGCLLTGSGVFLALWYRTVVGLPLRRRPRFLSIRAIRWGVPAVAVAAFFGGQVFLYSQGLRFLLITLCVVGLFAFLVLRFDNYSVEARNIYDVFKKIRDANPAMQDLEVLFRTAERRYPQWSQDRLLELVAGKDIESLILIMLVQENEINPLSDWGLYRGVREKVSRIVNGKRGLEMSKSMGVVLLSAVLGIGVAWGQEKGSEAGNSLQDKQLPRFAVVTDRLAVAGQPTNEGFSMLAAKGYQAVVNLRTAEEPVDLPAEEKLVRSLGMKYYHVPVVGTDLQPLQADEFLKAMDELKDKKVVLHCASANRVSGFMMIYRALRDGLTVEEAEAEARKAGMRSDALAAFARQVIGQHRKP